MKKRRDGNVKRRLWTDVSKKKAGFFFLSLLPLLIYYVLEVVCYLAAFSLTVGLKPGSLRESGSFVSPGIYHFLISAVSLILFGWWYAVLRKKDAQKPVRKTAGKKVLLGISMILLGVLLQVLVDGILFLLPKMFPSLSESFQSYQTQIQSVTENPSPLLFLSTVFFSPAAEEVLFRGVTLFYGEKAMPRFFAILLQALLFGLYHGNLIQGIYACLVGLLLGYLADRFHSVFPGMLLHTAVNLSAYFLSGRLF